MAELEVPKSMPSVPAGEEVMRGSKGAGGLGAQAGHQGQVLRTGHFATMWAVQQPARQWTNLIRTHN